MEDIIPASERVSIPGTLFYIPKKLQENELTETGQHQLTILNDEQQKDLKAKADLVKTAIGTNNASLRNLCTRGAQGKFAYHKQNFFIDYDKLKSIKEKIPNEEDSRIINNTIVLGDIVSIYATAVANNETPEELKTEIRALYTKMKKNMADGKSYTPILVEIESDQKYKSTIADKLCYLARDLKDEKGKIITKGSEKIDTNRYKSILQEYKEQTPTSTQNQSPHSM